MHHSVICYFIVLVCCHDQSFQILNRRDKWPNVVKMAPLLRTLQTAPSSLRPLTIKMLLDSFFEDTERYPLIIDGMPVSSVDLIGMVRNKSLSMDHCTFGLYDGTGSVNVYFWFDGRQDSKDAWSFNEGMYVRVVGRATSLEQFFQIKAYMVRTVKNFNDITHHFIYCIKAHIDISKQSRLKENSVATPSASTVMPRYQIAPSQIPEDCSFEDKIFSILRDPAYRDMDHGVSLKLLRSALGASQDDIMKVIIEQIRLGEMYTTIDERHFKSSN
ncbi:replication protein A 32 kDa subunit B-like isoform X2 [Triticum dicoccoides]|uniref:replication protein A 32 kDa subunit B-like isoform X2 n=1 Tax=Triticum dicoccoides TaxID=85692 RepID=UPI00188F228C|nr:replication protein A 32 kDa subunit B-like isoform X2 [Triticum dicoccoides]